MTTTGLSRGVVPFPGRDEIRVRSATTGDLLQINSLFGKCFGFEQPPAHFKAKYFDNAVATSVSMVAEADGHIVGHYGLWGMPLQLGFELVASAQSVDAMTHSDYRGRGLLVRLASAAMEVAARRGIDVLYGFPNARSYPASIRRLNWNHVRDVPLYSRPIRADGLRGVPVAMRGLTKAALTVWPRASLADHDVDTNRPHDDVIASILVSRSSADGQCQTGRFPRWYDWRFGPALGRDYRWITLSSHGRPVAFAVWQFEHSIRNGAMAELVGVDPAARAALVAAVMREAHDAGCATVTTMTTRPEVHRALRTNGFRCTGTLPLKVRPLNGRVLGANIHEPESWRVLGADCDIY